MSLRPVRWIARLGRLTGTVPKLLAGRQPNKFAPARSWVGKSFGGKISLLIRNIGLDELREEIERFLPADVASLDRNNRRHSLLRDVQVGSASYFLQGDGRVHFSGKVGVVEFVRVTDALVRHQFQIFSAEGVTPPGAEIGERHLVGAADLGIHLVNLSGKSVRRKPFTYRLAIEKLSI